MAITTSRRVVILGAAVYAGLFFWLFIRHFAPFGVWSVRTGSALVRGPFPEERVVEHGGAYEARETPVYFEVKNPRKFDRAQMRVTWRGDAPIVEAGVVKNQDPWRIETKVLYHKYLEELKWPMIRGNPHPSPLPGGEGENEVGELMLWQRSPRYKSVQEFLDNPPPVEEMATVNASWSGTQVRRYAGTQASQRYEVSLRGPQDFYLYTSGEDISVTLLVHDVNRHDGADPVEVKLYRRNPSPPPLNLRGGDRWEEVVHTSLPDDGIEWGTGETRPPRSITVEYKKPLAGVYRLVVEQSDDVFIRRVDTAQHKLVVKGNLYLGDETSYGPSRGPLTVWSNGQRFALRTPHPESTQTITFSSGAWHEALEVAQENHQYATALPRAVAGNLIAITLPKRDVQITTDGFFAFSTEAFFLPQPVSFSGDLDPDRLGINYVLAQYAPAQVQDGWLSNTVMLNTFDAAPSAPLQFFVSIPSGPPQALTVQQVQFTLRKSPLTLRRIRSILKGAL